MLASRVRLRQRETSKIPARSPAREACRSPRRCAQFCPLIMLQALRPPLLRARGTTPSNAGGSMRRSLAQLVALVFGVVFILVAVLGFITPGGMAMAMAMGASGGMLLGLFAVNLIHNVVHLVFGLWGVAASRTFAAAKAYCQATGVIYLVL